VDPARTDAQGGIYKASTHVFSWKMDFGPSAGTPNFNGGTILVVDTNNAVPLAAGQVYRPFVVNANPGVVWPAIQVSGTATNSYSIMSPQPPAPGAAWDISGLWIPATVRGVIAIRSVSTVPTNMSASYNFGGARPIRRISWAP